MNTTEWMEAAAPVAAVVMIAGVRELVQLLRLRETHRGQERLLLAKALRDAVDNRTRGARRSRRRR